MSSLMALVKELYHKLPAPPSTNYQTNVPAVDISAVLPENPVIFDIGSKNAQGLYFGKFPKDAKVVAVDIEAGPGVDLVADAHDLHMVPDNSVDYVTIISVLEHVRNPWQVVREIYRILKPGGIIYANIPFIFPYHADPDDFYRFSHRGIVHLCDGFERLDSGFARGPASTMHALLVSFFAILFSFNNKTLYGINIDLFKWLLFWVKYLDKLIGRYSVAYVIHTGSYFVGRKPREA